MKLKKSLRPPGRKKKSTAESAEIAELFLGKDKKHKFFMDMDSPLPFDPPGIKIRA